MHTYAVCCGDGRRSFFFSLSSLDHSNPHTAVVLELAMTIENIPIVDLLAERSAAVQTLDYALREFGFFYVHNHGISSELLQQQFQVASDLFALSREEKEAMPFDAQLDIGYVGAGVQTLNPDGSQQYSADTKEQFMMTNNKLITNTANTESDGADFDSDADIMVVDPDNVFERSKNYKPNVPGHAKIANSYSSAAYRLTANLNSLLMQALEVNEMDQAALTGKPFMVLKQMRYAGQISDPSQGKFGAGAHADWGSFTILATDATPGLQILYQDSWLPISPPQNDMLIINSGDQIAHLTNDMYKSAIHRVVTVSDKPRFSTAVFTYFNMDAKVGPMKQFVSEQRPAKYPVDRTTKDYFHYKLHESFS
jgi:isopenicillin N synthase-like dioxygenase